jgi:hypothetical protein
VGRSLLILVFLVSGCGAAQHFDAAERATATSPMGDEAAEYEIAGPDGRTAEVKVWSSGAYEGEVDGREVTVVEVVLEIENDGPAPVELTEVKIDSAEASGTSFEDVAPYRIEGEPRVAPGGERRLRAFFSLPERYDPEDIEQFEIEWSLAHGGGTYTQRTPFQQPPRVYADYPYPYFYDAPPFVQVSPVPWHMVP